MIQPCTVPLVAREYTTRMSLHYHRARLQRTLMEGHEVIERGGELPPCQAQQIPAMVGKVATKGGLDADGSPVDCALLPAEAPSRCEDAKQHAEPPVCLCRTQGYMDFVRCKPSLAPSYAALDGEGGDGLATTLCPSCTF